MKRLRPVQRFRQLIIFCFLAFLTNTVAALDITTASGRTYRDCKILEVQPDRIRIIHSTGVTTLDFEEVPESLRKEYRYDRVKAAEARQRRQRANTAAETPSKSAKIARPIAVEQSPGPPVDPHIAELKRQIQQLREENQQLDDVPQASPPRPSPASVASQPESTPAVQSSRSSEDQQLLTHSLTIRSNKRHNKSCRWYRTSRGRPCQAHEGIPCKVCGG